MKLVANAPELSCKILFLCVVTLKMGLTRFSETSVYLQHYTVVTTQKAVIATCTAERNLKTCDFSSVSTADSLGFRCGPIKLTGACDGLVQTTGPLSWVPHLKRSPTGSENGCAEQTIRTYARK